LEDWTSEDNKVRGIDLIVDEIDPGDMNLGRSTPAWTGWRGYRPLFPLCAIWDRSKWKRATINALFRLIVQAWV
jgi:putative alpha-1,2-mannosidase